MCVSQSKSSCMIAKGYSESSLEAGYNETRYFEGHFPQHETKIIVTIKRSTQDMLNVYYPKSKRGKFRAFFSNLWWECSGTLPNVTDINNTLGLSLGGTLGGWPCTTPRFHVRLISWNCRGTNDHRSLVRLYIMWMIKSFAPTLLFLSETKSM